MSSLSSISDSTGLDIIPELKVPPSSLPPAASLTIGWLQEDEENLDGSSGISLWEGAGTATTGSDYGPWGDAETKSFYEDLPGDILFHPSSPLPAPPPSLPFSLFNPQIFSRLFLSLSLA
jgi:hypothetical protein